jgi:hypothetical protein
MFTCAVMIIVGAVLVFRDITERKQAASNASSVKKPEYAILIAFTFSINVSLDILRFHQILRQSKSFHTFLLFSPLI